MKEELRLDKAKLVDARLSNANSSVENIPPSSVLFAMKPRRQLRHPSPIVHFDWSCDKRTILAVCKSSLTTIWDAFTGQKEYDIKTTYSANNSCSYGPSNTVIAVSGRADNVTLVNLKSKDDNLSTHRVGSHKAPVMDCKFFASDQQILTAGADCVCGLWDVQRADAVQMFKGHTGEILSIALKSKDPFCMFATSSADGSVRVWDPRTGECEMKFVGHEAPVGQVKFYPTSEALATASTDGTCRLFELRADQEITIFHKPSIVLGANTVDFTKSGRVMFVGYDDSTIRVWDVLKESQLAVWLGHTDRVAHVQVSPDGTALASASWDKYLKVWA